MRYIKRITAAFMAACMTVSLSSLGYAAAPKVEVDETAYILTDFYGAVEDYSVVKGCYLNGNTTFADYGDYKKVQNMTTLDQPNLFDEGVSWDIKNADGNRFYYEVTPKDQSGDDLPWHIDVSYKLNGSPISAEKLAGASGLVEITVDAIPNSGAKACYKDNFVLICTMMCDMADNTSFSAEGAQLQAIGSMQAAIFAALPKQQEQFVFKIGTDSFETSGVIVMMVPARLSQLDDISEMKEHKSNLEDAGNAMDSAMADILDIMGSMRGGISTTTQGLDQLESARASIDQNRDNIKKNVGNLRKSLKEMEKRLNDYGEFLGDADMADSISDIGDEISGTMEDMASDVAALNIAMTELSEAYRALADNSDGGDTQQEYQAFAEALDNAETVLNSVDISNYQRYIEKIENSVEKMNSSAESMEGADPSSDVYASAMRSILAECQSINNSLSVINQGSMNTAASMQNGLGSMDIISDELEDLLEETSWVVDDLADLMKDTRNMLDAVDKTLSDSGDALNEGTRLSIAGMNRMLTDLLAALQKTENIQSNRQIISDIIRDEWHRLDDEMGVLDIDTASGLVSFTSAKNSEPKTQQIILRTREISVDDDDDILQSAVEEEPQSAGDRIALVFKKIGDSISGFFKKG